MSDRDRSSPSLTDTPLKTYIGRHDDDYPLINGNGKFTKVPLTFKFCRSHSIGYRYSTTGVGDEYGVGTAVEGARPQFYGSRRSILRQDLGDQC